MELNPVDALSEGVSKGIDMFAIGLGDDMLNMSSSMNHTDSTYEGKLLVDIATFTYNPFRDPTVLNALKESALLYVLFLLMFIFIGGSYVRISRARPAREMLGMNTKNGMSLSEYIVNVFIFTILAPVVPFLMWLVLMFGYVCSNLIMRGILPSILFTPDNVTLYLAMCFIYTLMAASFVWRTLIIGLSVGYCLIIIAFLAIPYTRHIGGSLFTYFVVMVLMQPVILATTCAGVGIIQTIAPVADAWQSFCYLILSLFLFVVSLVFIFGPWTIMRLLGKAKQTIRLVL